MQDGSVDGGEMPSDSICLQLSLPDSESAAEFLRVLAQSETTAQVQSVLEMDDPRNAVVPVDLGVLTQKQREMVLLALEQGYYERPRRTTLKELAAETELSKSGVSQRLNAAERNLVQAMFGRFVEIDTSIE